MQWQGAIWKWGCILITMRLYTDVSFIFCCDYTSLHHASHSATCAAQAGAYTKFYLRTLNQYTWPPWEHLTWQHPYWNYGIHVYDWPGQRNRRAISHDTHVCTVGTNSRWCNSLADYFYIPKDSDQWKYPKLLLLAQASHKSLTTYANQFISLVMMGQYASGIRIRIKFM